MDYDNPFLIAIAISSFCSLIISSASCIKLYFIFNNTETYYSIEPETTIAQLNEVQVIR